jgi:hypothetical protein
VTRNATVSRPGPRVLMFVDNGNDGGVATLSRSPPVLGPVDGRPDEWAAADGRSDGVAPTGTPDVEVDGSAVVIARGPLSPGPRPTQTSSAAMKSTRTAQPANSRRRRRRARRSDPAARLRVDSARCTPAQRLNRPGGFDPKSGPVGQRNTPCAMLAPVLRTGRER